MANQCTRCDYKVHATALFCRACGSMTTRDQGARAASQPLADHGEKCKKTRQQNLQWEARMAKWKREQAAYGR